MMGNAAVGVAALLSTSAVGYLVCTKAMKEKKGSAIRAVGLGLGSVIIILSLLGTLCIAAKKCRMMKDFPCYKHGMMMPDIGKGPCTPPPRR